MNNKREGLNMYLIHYRFRKLSVLIIITILATMLIGVSRVNATEAVSGPVSKFVEIHGLGDEVFNKAYGEINDDDKILIYFDDPLQNDKRQATKAIQKAVNNAFGANKAKVERKEDEDGIEYFVIFAKKDISLCAVKSIVIKANSIVGADSQKSNPVDLLIYTPAPAQKPPSGGEPYIVTLGNIGLWDGIMNKYDDIKSYDALWFHFNQPMKNIDESIVIVQSIVDAAFGRNKAKVYPLRFNLPVTLYKGFVIKALEDIDLSEAKSIILPPNTLTSEKGIFNSRNIYIYIQPQGLTLPKPKPEPKPQPKPKPQAQPVSGPTYLGVLIKYGSYGNTVKLIQDKLNNLGYNCGAVDGIFGPKTKSAVIKFQSAKGLLQDGIVGPLTWVSLFANKGNIAKPVTNGDYSGLVKYGMQGEIVKKVQSKLLSLGFNPGLTDGIFGPKTLAAVKAYQKAKILCVDGIVGPITWKALFA